MNNEAGAKQALTSADIEAAAQVGRSHGAAKAQAAIDSCSLWAPWEKGHFVGRFVTEVEETIAEVYARGAWDAAWEADDEKTDSLVLAHVRALNDFEIPDED